MKYTRTVEVTEEIVLKPCPFCGDEPSFCYHGGCYGYTPSIGTLSCTCGAQMRVVSDDCKMEKTLLKELVAMWNRRVN